MHSLLTSIMNVQKGHFLADFLKLLKCKQTSWVEKKKKEISKERVQENIIGTYWLLLFFCFISIF